MPERMTAEVLGIHVDCVTLAEAIELITSYALRWRAARQREPVAQVVTLNPEMVMAARSDEALLQAIRRADLVVPDGIGVVLAARLAGAPMRARVTGVDLLEGLAAAASRTGLRLFLLGGGEGVAKAAGTRLAMRYPGVPIAGTYAGSPGMEDDHDILAAIRSARADIVFVAFGSPAQERWIARVRHQLDVAMAIGVGGALDFAAGRVPRAPHWMRRVGLEWMYRLIRQPWRWRRMLALPRFTGLVLLDSYHGRRMRVRGGYSRRFDAET